MTDPLTLSYQDILALDESQRRIDTDGRLHVGLTPLSKANICEYFGREIPDADALGLDPDKKYALFRDPEELKKAAHTFNNIPLVYRHPTNAEGPLTADNPQEHLIVGSTGTDAVFNDPFLENSLVIWKDTSIDGVMSDRKKQLSAGYRYKAVMEPGTYLGAKFDGRMTEIFANHEALVIDGRAGADVMVTDSLPLELRNKETTMATTPALNSRKALVAQGAILAYIRPKLAVDAALPDMKKVLLGTTAKNWQQAKPMIVSRMKEATRGKLAADASLEDMHGLLDSLDKPTEGMDDMDDDMSGDRAAKDAEMKAKDAKRARDEGTTEEEARKKREAEDARSARDARRAMDESEETEEEREARLKKRADDKRARDAEPEDETEEEKKKRLAAEDRAARDRRARDAEPKPVSKAAMDAALESQRVTLMGDWKKQQADLREAEQIVRPVLGILMAQDSAEDVYNLLFSRQGIDTAGVPPAAFKALAQVAVKAATMKTSTTIARDHAAAKSFAERHPEVARITCL
jgi:hypothetical protein